MFNLFKKEPELKAVEISDQQIAAMADGKMIDITTVPDPMFSEQMMGKSIAFKFEGNKYTVCSPANGELTTVFPTGHAFGITTSDGVQILVHIGVDTVNSKGDGFKLLGKKQGARIKAGEPVVEVDQKKLSAKYDMSVMLIITDANEKNVDFTSVSTVKRGQVVGTVSD